MKKYISSPGIFNKEEIHSLIDAAVAYGMELSGKVNTSDKSNQVIEVEIESEEDMSCIVKAADDFGMLVFDTFPTHLFE